MAVMTSLYVPADGWTVDDRPDVDFRYELVDGALLVTPPEAPRNARVTSRLLLRLAPELDETWDVLSATGSTSTTVTTVNLTFTCAVGALWMPVGCTPQPSCSPSRS